MLTLLTVEDLSDRTGISRSHIFREIRAGKLPTIRMGKLLRISEVDAEAWLAAARVTA